MSHESEFARHPVGALDVVAPLRMVQLAQTQWSPLGVVRACGPPRPAAFHPSKMQVQSVPVEVAVALVSWL